MIKTLTRIIAMLFGISFGYMISAQLIEFDIINVQGTSKYGFISGVSILSALLFFVISPFVSRRIIGLGRYLDKKLYYTPVQDIIAGIVGLIIGLVMATLLISPLTELPIVGPFLPFVANLTLGYLGYIIAISKWDDVLSLFGKSSKDKRAGQGVMTKILDTSVIIDGRIADICDAHFIEGKLIIPGFVLEELRHIADSSDTLKRNRGRRGLDILNRIQKEIDVPVIILENDTTGEGLEVDSRLVKLAQKLKGMVVTNDYNLNKVCELQGVPVLNINELANAVKPVVLPGEEMLVEIVKDGKEAGQGIGYLDDGTMIVVDGGKNHIGENLDVLVTSVLQTAAGRMIFAKIKTNPKAS
ncbi:PIN/TRAM domain-containing protein [Proteinivorax hydrogeniformans]|uniref:PIN/TRAM domain-containing protein n=1 Tax=Proteinivorax hydrogeniformans TaxID=1826727 RepID=A0AAU8HTE6_9FIRM